MIYPNLMKYAKTKGYNIKWITKNFENNSIHFELYPTVNTMFLAVIGFIISDEEITKECTDDVYKELSCISEE